MKTQPHFTVARLGINPAVLEPAREAAIAPTQDQTIGQCEPRMTICVLAACPFPAHHGTPGSIREMAEAVAGRGHEVHIATYHFGQDIAVQGPSVHRIRSLTNETKVVVGPTVRKPLYDFQLIFKTLQVIRRHRPVLIHAHGYEAALIAGVCRLVTGLPVLYSAHNLMGDELAGYDFMRPKWLVKRLANLLDRLVPRIATRCLPHSANLAKYLKEQGLHRLEPVVPFGIDLDAIPRGDGAAVRARYGLGGGPVVLYAGVTDQFQRLDLLLEAMQRVVRHEPSAKLLVVVSIPNENQLAALRSRAEMLRIANHLVLTEPLPYTAVREVLPACDVAVVPRPRTPGFSIKLLNYMAAQRPCVLFASSAGGGLVEGENARLATPDTSEALGEAILDVLRDDSLRQRLARGGYQHVRENHDRRLVAQQICDAYRRTLDGARRSRARGCAVAHAEPV